MKYMRKGKGVRRKREAKEAAAMQMTLSKWRPSSVIAWGILSNSPVEIYLSRAYCSLRNRIRSKIVFCNPRIDELQFDESMNYNSYL